MKIAVSALLYKYELIVMLCIETYFIYNYSSKYFVTKDISLIYLPLTDNPCRLPVVCNFWQIKDQTKRNISQKTLARLIVSICTEASAIEIIATSYLRWVP